MDEHKKFLADRLLSEEQPITYRLLSRALDVHVNTAKEMLFDFHKYQNAIRADSVHATYLIYGIKGSSKAQDDGDVEMASSMPDQEDMSEEVTTSTMTLAREEELNDVLAGYKQVTSIHVYSLAPHPQRDLTLLCDLTTQLSEYTNNGDVEAAVKKYGIIFNPQMRRRDRKGKPQAVSSTQSKSVKQEAAKPEPVPVVKEKQEEPAVAQTIKQDTPVVSSKPASSNATPSSSGTKKPAPSLKRGGSGGIMQSFARAAAKPPKPKPVSKEAETPKAMSDDGEADDADLAPSSKPAANPEDIRKARKEREDALRRMMEDDDEEDEAAEEDKDDEPEDEDMEEAPEPEPEAVPEPKEEDREPAEVVASSGDGRRRGKRRVMKKKRILDDQGYMVTIQEPDWESFSEDEAPPPAKKPAPTPTPSSSASSKAKKPAGKGQGNIMSFFSKK